MANVVIIEDETRVANQMRGFVRELGKESQSHLFEPADASQAILVKSHGLGRIQWATDVAENHVVHQPGDFVSADGGLQLAVVHSGVFGGFIPEGLAAA